MTTVSGTSTTYPTAVPIPKRDVEIQKTECASGEDDRGDSIDSESRGAVMYAGYAMNHDGTLRAEYQRRAAGLSGAEHSSQSRSDLRADIQARSTPFGSRLAKHLAASPQRAARNGAKTNAELEASAVRTNPTVNLLGTAFRAAGRALLAAGVVKSAYDIAEATPQERPRTISGEAGSWAGALAGGTVGAELGGTLGSIVPGPGTVVGAAVGGLLGGAYGSISGEELGKTLYDTLTCAH
ncbi:MAG TPA: hypothetical protein VME66_06285 [Candidatus Acidoferrales bacterium]|nr:hypothetical protein [Candidatus Acidoferrales bacterium]